MYEKDMTVEFIKRISGQQAVLTIPRVYLEMLDGDIKTALFMSQVIYWSDKGKRADGWFYKTDKEWKDELCLSEYECKKARDKLMALDVLLVDKKKANGVPTMHYKVHWENLSKWVMEKFKNRTVAADDDISVSEKLDNPIPKKSETGSQEIPESLTKSTTKNTNKENNYVKNSSNDKQTSLFNLPSNTPKVDYNKELAKLKGKAKLVRTIEYAESGFISLQQLTDLDLCFYFSQKHKEIVGYEIPYQKEQYMKQFRIKNKISVEEMFTLIPNIAATFRKICEDDKRKKSEWYLKIGWFIYDAPSDIARVMDKVRPKLNEKYVQKDEAPAAANLNEVVDEVF